MSRQVSRFTAVACSLPLSFASPLFGEDAIPLPLPVREPLAVDSFLAARRVRAPVPSFELWLIAEIEGTNSDATAFGDTDHDGRNEIITVGYPCGYRIFEEQGGNAYSLEYTGPCLYPYATGDFDGDGKSEIVGQRGGYLEIYEAPDATSFDLNQNGRPEVIWPGGPTTLILEYRSGVSAAEESRGQPQSSSLAAHPNPCRVEAGLRVSRPIDAAASLAVYDVSGRVVQRRLLIPDARGQVLWPTRHLPSGVYMLRLESASGRTLAVGRGTVLR